MKKSISKIKQSLDSLYASRLEEYGLTPKELEVALYALDGFTMQATAEQMNISISTVKFHIGNVYHKTGVQSKIQLIQLIKCEDFTP